MNQENKTDIFEGNEANLRIWNQVQATDLQFTKAFKSGNFKGLAINSSYQRKLATAVFGPIGLGWGTKQESYDIIHLSEDKQDTILVYSATLWYTINNSIAELLISSEIKAFRYWREKDIHFLDTDIYKKVKTDAVTKGLSELGFNSDIHMGLLDKIEPQFEDNKYLESDPVPVNGKSSSANGQHPEVPTSEKLFEACVTALSQGKETIENIESMKIKFSESQWAVLRNTKMNGKK